MPNKKLRVLSLFSGCGGMDLGFAGGFDVLRESINTLIHPDWIDKDYRNGWVHVKRNAFDTVFANDIRPDAQAAWCNFFGGRGTVADVYHLESIVDLVKKYRNGDKSIFPTNIDVVTGGFPCQDFSVAGKRLGFDSNKSHSGGVLAADEPTAENRGHLYMWMREVISIVKPKLFFAENVKGLTNLGDAKQVIERDFASIADGGYLIIPAQVLNAAHYGVPQGRQRVIFIGFKKSALNEKAINALTNSVIPSKYNPYPLITHYLPGEAPQAPLSQFVTVRIAMQGLEEPGVTEDVDQTKYAKAKFLNKRLQGQQEVQLDGIGPTIRSEHHGNIEFRRLSEEHGGKHVDELAKGLEERRLTIRECARIQTFPDSYHFVIPAKNGLKNVSASDAYKIIGNAVPPLLAYNLARNIQEKWEDYFGKCKSDCIDK